ncbi:C-terminal helicase domain-containing protein [Pseudonocardia sulfidoxydans]|uniref:C-terminal helicase domain-containing protein n=1 Tax=Pseudonocardia sulfidoxydans TaxID=54011 RepID=UPI00361945AD
MRRAALESTSSAKLERIREIVDEAAEDGMKVLVFTTFLPVLTLLAQELPGVVGRIDGSVSTTARQELVDAFSAWSGHAVLLSQIEAGGVGSISRQRPSLFSPSRTGSPASRSRPSPGPTAWARSGRSRCTAFSRRTPSTSGSWRFSRARRCPSTHSPAAASQKSGMLVRWTSVLRLSTTNRCPSNSGPFAPSVSGSVRTVEMRASSSATVEFAEKRTGIVEQMPCW